LKTSVFVFLVSLMLADSATYGQSLPQVAPEFEAELSLWMQEANVPAVSICTIENGEISYLRSFGRLKSGMPVPENPIFNLASMTKPVATLVALALVEDGIWSMDEPLYHYWVDPDVAKDPLHKKLTTRHVLLHKTGFQNWRRASPSNKLVFEFEPGTKHFYSGEGFEYLRRAIERKLDTSFESLVASLVLEPAGMTDTGYWSEDTDMGRFAYPHDSAGDPYDAPVRSGVGAANNLLSTARDYCRFFIYILQGAGLSDSLYQQMIDPRVDIGQHTGRGLGWLILKDLPNGEYGLSHGGSNSGIKTQGFLLPESKRGLVVLTNGDNGFSVINNLIRTHYEDGDAIVNSMYGLSPRRETPVSGAVLDRFTGKWIDNLGRTHRIRKGEDNRLRFSGEGVPSVTLYAESETTFFLKDFDVQFVFESPDTLILVSGGNVDWTARKINQ